MRNIGKKIEENIYINGAIDDSILKSLWKISINFAGCDENITLDGKFYTLFHKRISFTFLLPLTAKYLSIFSCVSKELFLKNRNETHVFAFGSPERINFDYENEHVTHVPEEL